MSELRADARIGIDLGGTKIAGVRLDSTGRVLDEHRLATPKHDYAASLHAIVDLAGRLDPEHRLLIGIGTPGSVIAASGLMQNCNSTWLNGQPLHSDLNARLSGRVRIANDADCFTLSEATDGSAAGMSPVFGVILGTGVGGGLVINGQLVSGPGGLTGEWGHNPLPFDDRHWPQTLKSRLPSRQCYCGQLNCVETYLSGPGLSVTHQALWSEDAGAEAIYNRALQVAGGESALTDWLLENQDNLALLLDAAGPDAERAALCSIAVYCTMLASALTIVVNVLDPQVIVLGGGLSKMQSIYRPVARALQQRSFGGRGETLLMAPKFGDASGVRGAAWLWNTSGADAGENADALPKQ